LNGEGSGRIDGNERGSGVMLYRRQEAIPNVRSLVEYDLPLTNGLIMAVFMPTDPLVVRQKS